MFSAPATVGTGCILELTPEVGRRMAQARRTSSNLRFERNRHPSEPGRRTRRTPMTPIKLAHLTDVSAELAP